MKYLLLLLSFMFLFSTSCDTTSPEELDKNAILDILDSIQLNFNMDDLDGIMQNYHLDFNHNGDSFDWEKTIWEVRLNDYNDLNFEDIEIELNGNYATAYFSMHLDDTITEEPSDENGDISYFYRELGSWKLCGKDFIILP
ncbi:MAG: hypothetical protein U9P73_04595 [Candidatus Cloacimonadota bacterium]|nr:hypothetical protein [Candidatus Cloacimonadota bacterium]